MNEEVAEQEVVEKKKKPRSEAQQLAFKVAVEKLKAKREVEREAKARARAELDLRKTEEKTSVLKARLAKGKAEVVETKVEAPSVQADYSHFMKQVEKMLDERLPKKEMKVEAPAVMIRPQPQGMPPAWYDALFVAKR